MTDATAVFDRIDKDLDALDTHVKLLELFHHGFEMAESVIDSDHSQFFNSVVRLTEENKKLKELVEGYKERIETLEMGLAFANSNGQADAMRIQRLEEQYDDLRRDVSAMQDKLCTCGKVQVFWLCPRHKH